MPMFSHLLPFNKNQLEKGSFGGGGGGSTLTLLGHRSLLGHISPYLKLVRCTSPSLTLLGHTLTLLYSLWPDLHPINRSLVTLLSFLTLLGHTLTLSNSPSQPEIFVCIVSIYNGRCSRYIQCDSMFNIRRKSVK